MIADLKPYPKYKDSGVEWLGEVPEGWRVVALREVGRFIKGSGGSKEDEVPEGIPCVRYGDLYGFHSFHIDSSRSFVTADRAEGYARVRVGDILFAASGETLDEIGKSAAIRMEGPVRAGGDLIILRPAIDVDPTFMGYACDSPLSIWQKARMGKGVTVMHIYPQALRHLQLTLPPIEEQVGIGRFLDLVWRRVDDAIHQREQLIDLLEGEKQAVIHRAVTRGLDPNVRLKPSGVDWLGDVPEHWESMRLHELTDSNRPIMYGIVLPGPHVDDGVPIVKGGNCEPGRLEVAQLSRTTREIESRYARSRLTEGDIVIAIRGGVGAASLVPPDLAGANLTQDAARISHRSDVSKEWLLQMLRSNVVQEQLTARVRGATVKGINIRDLKRIPLAVPPLEEQCEIARHVEQHASRTELAAKSARRQIDLLDELRIRLISDVVTGKLDVRDAAARLPADPGVAEAAPDEAIEGVVA